jgi:hypothetical protein
MIEAMDFRGGFSAFPYPRGTTSGWRPYERLTAALLEPSAALFKPSATAGLIRRILAPGRGRYVGGLTTTMSF